ncbi:MAG: LytTR family DNA-binding domain-containing protein [Pseudomonadota bacterium]
MLTTVVCDDEKPALELMVSLLDETGAVDIKLATQSIVSALEAINNGGVDLVIFDVDMPRFTGVEAAQKIAVAPKPLLVFTTAHPEYAVEAFGVDAIDYVLKPLTPQRIAQAIDKAVRMNALIAASETVSDTDVPETHDSGPEVLKVKDMGNVYFVPFSEVTSIEAAGDYSLVHTADRDYAMRKAIRTLESELPVSMFIRVHRSAIVAVPHVREVRTLPKGEASILMSSGKTVKSSRSYKEAVRRLIDAKSS